jgi:hypothetical protein
MVIEDVTAVLQAEADKVDAEAKAGAEKLKTRRPVQNFFEMGILEGAELKFTQGDFSCRVINGRRVSYNGVETSLTALMQKLLDTNRPLRPSPHWLFNGWRLSEIFNETYV